MNLDPAAERPHEFHGARRRDAEGAVPLSFPGRQRVGRAAADARADSRRLPGTTAEDSVTAKVDYGQLDRDGAPHSASA